MTNLTIKRVGVLSLAKIFGLIFLVIGLIVGVIYGLFIMLFGAAMMSRMGGDAGGAAAGGVVVGGLAAMVIMPLFYSVLGFVMGAIYALVFNAASGFLGGLELQVEGAGVETFNTPPPPPQQYN
ncbi:MAG: hypothetical protein ACJ74W_01605 [Pyrinomonadaceae bacterium]